MATSIRFKLVTSGPPARRAPTKNRHSKKDWSVVKQTIQHLFYDKELTLEEVIKELSDQHGFNATVSQYRHKIDEWAEEDGRAKYLKLSQVQRVQAKQTIASRTAEGKSKHSVHDPKSGTRFDLAKTKRCLRRHKDKDEQTDQDQLQAMLIDSPKILVFTPPNIASSPRASTVSHSLLEQGVGAYPDDMPIDQAPESSPNLSESSPVRSLTILPKVTFRLSDIIRVSAVLPYFELKDKIQDFITRTKMSFPSSSSEHHQRALITSTSTVIPLPERQELPAIVLDYLQGETLQAEYSGSIFVSRIAEQVPERFQGELRSEVKRLLGPFNGGLLLVLFQFIAFYASNTLLSKYQLKRFIHFILEHRHVTALSVFLHAGADIPTIKTFIELILDVAISMLFRPRKPEDTFTDRELDDLVASLPLSGIDPKDALPKVLRLRNRFLVRQLLERVDPTFLSGAAGGRLLLYIPGGVDLLDTADVLVRKGADVNFYSPHNSPSHRTPLVRAVYFGQVRMVEFLLEKGADPNSFQPPLMHAFGFGFCYEYDIRKRYKIVELLIDKGAKIPSSLNDQPILAYLLERYPELYQLVCRKMGQEGNLLSAKEVRVAASQGKKSFESFYLQNQERFTQRILEIALKSCIGNDHEAFLVLLGSGFVDPSGPTLNVAPILVAARLLDEGCEAVLWCRPLMDAGASLEVDGLLFEAVKSRTNNLELLRLLLDSGVDVEKQGPRALEEAAMYGKLEAVKLLLTYPGISVDAMGEFFTAIQAAAFSGDLKIVRYLLDEKGADLNADAYFKRGRTALQAACGSGNVELIEFLLQNGAKINANPAKTYGRTAFEAASTVWHDDPLKGREIFTLLLKYGANPWRSRHGQLPFIHRLIGQKWLDLVAVVLQMPDADPNLMAPADKVALTPLQFAAREGNLEAVKLLIENKADICSPPSSRYGRTALQAAASLPFPFPNLEMVKYLVENGADVNAEAARYAGITAIQGAAIAGYIPIAEYLLEKGANINAEPSASKGRTCIEGAAEHGRLDMVQWLLNMGAKGDEIRGQGFGYRYAIKLAEDEGHNEIAKILRSAEWRHELDEQAAIYASIN